MKKSEKMCVTAALASYKIEIDEFLYPFPKRPDVDAIKKAA